MDQVTAGKLADKKVLDELIREVPMSADDSAFLDGDSRGGSDIDELEAASTQPADGGPPEWCTVPPTMKFPTGRQVLYARFRARMTDVPSKGERQCIMWNLSEADEKLALKRTRGDGIRAIDELAKQMIRAVDGHVADWSGTSSAGNINKFWDEIGGKCRQQLKNAYAKAHTFDPDEQVDFLTNCIAVRTVGI